MSRVLNKKLSVLVESGRDGKSGFLKGRTTNYIPVFIDDKGEGEELKKKIVDVKLTQVTDKGMIGEL